MAAILPGSRSPSTGSTSAASEPHAARPEPPYEADPRNGLRRLLRRSRRRLRANRALRALARVAPWAAGVALVIAGLGRVVDLAWADPIAIVGALAALVAATAGAALRRVSLMDAALAADSGLRTGEVLSTSLELGDRSDVLANRVRQQARVAAGSGSARRAVPLHADPKRLGAALLIGALAGWAIVAFNPQDARRAERAETRRVLDLAATRVRVAASTLSEDDPADEAARQAQLAADAATAARLEELARQIEQLDNLEDAEALLQRAEADLGASLTAETEARKAAATGLDRTLAMLPLLGFANPNSPETAAAQLDRASKHVAGMRDEELDALAKRLAALAETQRLGDPELEAALERANQALRARDREAAGAALAEAADLQRSALAEVEAAESRAELAGEVGAAANDVNRARRARDASRAEAAGGGGQEGQQGTDGTNGRSNESNGEGGAGQSGLQAGEGQSQGGQGAGQNPTGAGGSQQGASGDRGNGGAAGARGGTGSGLSDLAASAGAGDQDTAFPELAFDEVDEPIDVGSDAILAPGGTAQPGAAPGAMVELTDVPTADGGGTVPLAQALPSYEAQATTALERPDIPAEDRVLVRRYFDELNQG